MRIARSKSIGLPRIFFAVSKEQKIMKISIEKLFIQPNTTIRKAMQTITRAGRLKLPVGIALVVDRNQKLIGTVTDGDIRRALVKGFDLNDPANKIMARGPITVGDHLTVDEMIRTAMTKVKESGRIRDDKVDKVIVTDRESRVVDVVNFYELWSKQELRYKKICIVGTGYVGLTLSLALAEVGYKVVGIDTNRAMVARLNRGESPFYEKGLQPLLRHQLKENNLTFTSLWKPEGADVYILCVGTPIEEKTHKPVYDSLLKATEDVGKVLKKDDLVILRSTVPVGTTRKIVMPILEKTSAMKAGKDFYLVFAPERVVEGKALEEMKEIPQVMGGVNKQSVQMAGRVFQVFNPSIIILDSLEEAEMVKLINNSFRDLSFAFSNKIALMCEKLNLDAVKIIKASNDGYPRNPVALPSPGVGGYCLTKDPFLMAEVAKRIHVGPEMFLESRKINKAMPHFVAHKVIRFIKTHWTNEKRVKIFLMGFAYKGYPETSDMRGSPTVDVLKILKSKLKNKVVFYGYDPVAKREEIEGLDVTCVPSKEGFKNAQAVLILNNNPEFAKIDIFSLLETMTRPGLLFDGWHFFLPQEVKKIKGISYQGMGAGFD
jgi:nucleotide sugar dehydrogenase